jgi:NADH dehydrogenase
MEHKTQILVLGAGYAGLMAAIRLAGKTHRHPVSITLVNAVDTFVERIRLHESAVGKQISQHSIVHMLRGTGVEFLSARVIAIHREAREVTVQCDGASQELRYDYLVYALGSQVDQQAVPGVREHAYALNPDGPNNAVNLRARLNELAAHGGQVVIVGGGATGIEGAGEIRSSFPNFEVSLVTEGAFGDFKHNKAVQTYMRQALTKRGVAIHEYSRVIEVRAGELVLADGTLLPCDLCLWAGGFKASSLAREADLQTNEQGRILVDEYLRSLSDPAIYAIGDAAMPTKYTGAPYRMSAFVALVTGAHTADNLSAQVKGRPQKPFSYSTYGQGIALGEGQGIGFATLPNDLPVGPLYKGKLGASIRNFFVWFLVLTFAIERRIPGFLFWLGKGRYKQQAGRTKYRAQQSA